MAPRQKRADDEPAGERRSGARRLIAGLRISREEEALLAVVRPYMTDLSSEGELAYRLWRRGLELTIAEFVGLGAALPPAIGEELIASLVAQRLLLCMPLLRRTGKLALLGMKAFPLTTSSPTFATSSAAEVIDENASDAIAGLGGSDFL